MQHLETSQILRERLNKSAHAIVGDTDVFVNHQCLCKIGRFSTREKPLRASRIPIGAVFNLDLRQFQTGVAALLIKVDLSRTFASADRYTALLGLAADVRELGDTFEDHVDKLDIQRRCKHQKERLKLHFLIFSRIPDSILCGRDFEHLARRSAFAGV